MGAGNVLPVVPVFTTGAPSIAQLNQLAYAVSFLADNGVRPAWNFFRYPTTQAVAANTWTNVSYDHTAFDSDGVQSYPYAVIKTQGYYAVSACVQIQATAGGSDVFTSAFLFTAGASNPHYTAGATQYFGFRGGKMSSTAQAAADNAACPADTAPMVCYPGDKLSVAVYCTAAKTIDINSNTSYTQGRFAAKFAGHWMRQGT